MRLNEFGDPRRGDAPCALAEPGALVSLGGPTLAVFGVRRGDLAPMRFALALVESFVAAGTPVVVYSLRRAEGPFESDSDARGATFVEAGALAYRGGRVAADAHAIDAQLAAWAVLDAGAVRVALGTDFVARARARVVVALTAGLPQVGFSPAARSVVARAGLQLAEPRVAVAAALVGRLLAG